MQGVWVQSLVGKLRSYMSYGHNPPKKNIKQKQYCNKFSKNFNWKKKGNMGVNFVSATYIVAQIYTVSEHI